MSQIGVAACRARRSTPGESRRGMIRCDSDTQKNSPPGQIAGGAACTIWRLSEPGAPRAGRINRARSKPRHGTWAVSQLAFVRGSRTSAGPCRRRRTEPSRRPSPRHPAGMKHEGLAGSGGVEGAIGRAGAVIVRSSGRVGCGAGMNGPLRSEPEAARRESESFYEITVSES